MTFPVTKRDIRDLLKDAAAKGTQCLAEFVESNQKGKGGYCINWADLSLTDVRLAFDEDGDMTLIFEFEEGDCGLFRAYMAERLREVIPNDFYVEVDISW